MLTDSLIVQDLADSSEEEEDGGNDYDLEDKFLVADEDASEEGEGGEGEGGEAGAKRRRKRKRRREEQLLDEEDYELIVRTHAGCCYSCRCMWLYAPCMGLPACMLSMRTADGSHACTVSGSLLKGMHCSASLWHCATRLIWLSWGMCLRGRA